MSRFFVAIIWLSTCCSGVTASIRIFDNEADFLQRVDSDYYREDFSAFSPGFVAGPLEFGPVNGFSYSVYDRTPDGEPNINGLFSGPGVMSTDTDTDTLVVEFSGGDVTAVGGNFFLTDFNFGTVGGGLTIELNDGSTTSLALNDPTPSTFRGITSIRPIRQIAFTASIADTWPTIDNLSAASAICRNRFDCNSSWYGDFSGATNPSPVPEPNGLILLLTAYCLRRHCFFRREQP